MRERMRSSGWEGLRQGPPTFVVCAAAQGKPGEGGPRLPQLQTNKVLWSVFWMLHGMRESESAPSNALTFAVDRSATPIKRCRSPRMNNDWI